MLIEHIQSWVRKRVTRWHSIIDFAVEPCEAPFSAYLNILPGAAANAAITLLSFGWDDIARGALRPRAVNPKSHIRRWNGRRRNIGIPEIGEQIGKRLPGAKTIKGRAIGVGEHILWLGDGLIQEGLFWLMVYDIAEDFAYDFVSGIKKSGFCTLPGLGKFLAIDTGQIPFRPWDFFSPWLVDLKIPYGAAQIIASSGQFNMALPSNYRYTVVWECANLSPAPITFTLQHETQPPLRIRRQTVTLPALPPSGIPIVVPVRVAGTAVCQQLFLHWHGSFPAVFRVRPRFFQILPTPL